jgi:hypothetical protein
MPSVKQISSFLPSGVAPDDYQDTLRLFREPGLQMEAIGPAIDIT